jgi:hypothetical protein
MNDVEPEGSQKVESRKFTSSVGSGLALVWSANLIHIAANFFLWASPLGIFAIKYFGISQLLYVVPLALYARRKGKEGRLKGIIIAGSITFLLGALCFSSFMESR